MIVYTVHEPGIPAKSLDERADEAVFVKEGFTGWGFWLAPAWLLFNALWLELFAALLLAAVAGSVLTQLGLKDQVPAIAYFLLMLIVGFEGNGMRRAQLERKGYVFVAPVAGHNLEECERRFFDAWLPSAAARYPGPEAKQGSGAARGSFGGWAVTGVVGTFPGEVA
jgi:hypothetical protein